MTVACSVLDALEAPADIYDPTTGRFAATGSLTPGGGEYGDPARPATLLADGRVFVAPAANLADARADVYDPVSGTFAQSASCPVSTRSDGHAPPGRAPAGHLSVPPVRPQPKRVPLRPGGRHLQRDGCADIAQLRCRGATSPTAGCWSAVDHLGRIVQRVRRPLRRATSSTSTTPATGCSRRCRSFPRRSSRRSRLRMRRVLLVGPASMTILDPATGDTLRSRGPLAHGRRPRPRCSRTAECSSWATTASRAQRHRPSSWTEPAPGP